MPFFFTVLWKSVKISIRFKTMIFWSTPLNTATKNLIFIFLLSCTLALSACGSKEVKSEKVPETDLKSGDQTIAPPMVSMTSTDMATPTVVNTYTRHTSFIKHHTHHHAVKEPIMAASTPLVPHTSTPVTTPVNFTIDNETTQKKSSSHWPLIVAGIALAAALGFYFWTKKTSPRKDFPLPPMGGLSPVGGFTAMRNKVQPETKKSSFWAKKLF